MDANPARRYGPPSPPFSNPNNITIGKGRVIYAEALGDLSPGGPLPAGYVLPGGRRTQDREEAAVVAYNINNVSKAA